MSSTKTSDGHIGKIQGFFQEIKKNKYLYLLALPGIIFLVVFSYLPMFGHLIAFKKYEISKGIWGSSWVGFDNFKFFFLSQDWIRVTYNTIFLNGLFIIFGLGISVILAIFINEVSKVVLKKLAQSCIFLPYFISWLVVSLMVYALFNSTDGLINRALVKFGQQSVNWYLIPKIWPTILTAIYIWKFSGYYSIIFLAAIVGISTEYYESAKLDGATRFQQIRYITLPLLRPTIIVLALLGIGRIFYGDFGMIYGIIGDTGVLYSTTDVIDTYSYRALRQLGNFSMSSAVVLYQSIMGLITIVLFNWLVKRVDKDAGLF